MTRMATDLSSILWTCLRTGKDPEGIEVNHDGKPMWVNTAAHGYEAAVNSIVAGLNSANLTPINLIIVEEGLNSKRRRTAIDPQYKASRGSKPPEENEQFQLLRDMVVGAFSNLGAIRVSQEGVEGDDVLGWLAKHTEEDLIVHTFDNDLMVLHGKNEYGAMVTVRIKGEAGVNKYGPFPHKLISAYKALVGDSSDNIKGCPGFGPAMFLDFISKYGEDGFEELHGLMEKNTLKELQQLDDCKIIRKLLENEVAVLKSYKCAKIHPEWVDTVNTQLEWYPGMVTSECSDSRLKQWRQQKRLVTTKTLKAAYDYLKVKLAETKEFSFDIETSTGPESDEWLEAAGNPNGVDVLGSKLTGFSLTFGANMQYTYYVCVDHRDTANIEMEDARLVMELVFKTGKPVVIQNTAFEGVVLAQAEDGGQTWLQHWKDNGYRGFIPNWLDTVFEASYVNENISLGLKQRSLHYLGYQQTSYEETTSKTGVLTELPSGGRVTKVIEYTDVPLMGDGANVVVVDGVEQTKQVAYIVTKQYKMNELTGEEVFDYGCDDTICTAALHNFYKLHMQLDHHWKVYLDVEIGASYQHVKNFLDGKVFSMEAMKEQEKSDDVVHAEAWKDVRAYLIEKGWQGTVPPTYSSAITAKEIKQAYSIYMQVDEEDEDEGEEAEVSEVKVKDPIMSTRVRTPSKFPALLRAEGVDEMFVQGLEGCMQSEAGAEAFTRFIRGMFAGEPIFKFSNKQMKELLYTTMELPVRVYNKPTVLARKRGEKQGSPMTNALAVKYALQDCTPEQKTVLLGLQLMQMVQTRRSLYYKPYPGFIHWKTGRIHSSHRQCATNTRRASSAAPNDQQQPKHVKIEGQKTRFRECTVPHKKNAIIVSLDFSQQELRVIADYSKDQNMVDCYVGDNLKDMHVLTALGIIARKHPDMKWDHDTLAAAYADKNHPQHAFAKEFRKKGKDTNFTTEFGAAAPKLAQTLLVPEDEAQDYIDAKEAAFPDVRVWKDEVIDEAKETGKSWTKMGAVRHLTELLNSDDRFVASKAERQAVNFRVQSSSAEMTKKAEGRVWEAGLTFKYDAVCYGPVHDELVFSVGEDDLLPFIKEAHACMTAPYGGMFIPIESSISFGPNFGVQFEIGTAPTEEAVQVGFNQWQKWKEEAHV